MKQSVVGTQRDEAPGHSLIGLDGGYGDTKIARADGEVLPFPLW